MPLTINFEVSPECTEALHNIHAEIRLQAESITDPIGDSNLLFMSFQLVYYHLKKAEFDYVFNEDGLLIKGLHADASSHLTLNFVPKSIEPRVRNKRGKKKTSSKPLPNETYTNIGTRSRPKDNDASHTQNGEALLQNQDDGDGGDGQDGDQVAQTQSDEGAAENNMSQPSDSVEEDGDESQDGERSDQVDQGQYDLQDGEQLVSQIAEGRSSQEGVKRPRCPEDETSTNSSKRPRTDESDILERDESGIQSEDPTVGQSIRREQVPERRKNETVEQDSTTDSQVRGEPGATNATHEEGHSDTDNVSEDTLVSQKSALPLTPTPSIFAMAPQLATPGPSSHGILSSRPVAEPFGDNPGEPSNPRESSRPITTDHAPATTRLSISVPLANEIPPPPTPPITPGVGAECGQKGLSTADGDQQINKFEEQILRIFRDKDTYLQAGDILNLLADNVPIQLNRINRANLEALINLEMVAEDNRNRARFHRNLVTFQAWNQYKRQPETEQAKLGETYKKSHKNRWDRFVKRGQKTKLMFDEYPESIFFFIPPSTLEKIPIDNLRNVINTLNEEYCCPQKYRELARKIMVAQTKGEEEVIKEELKILEETENCEMEQDKETL